LRDVRRQIEDFAAARGCDSHCCDDLGLVANEALANVMRHAYHGATDQPIEIVVQDFGAKIELRIRDWGVPFDPAVLKRREYDPLEPGGLGVICMKRLMDDVTWTRQDKGMMLTLTRHKCG
jgi:anti-sigma regulatory factor (Ser/Thr protein kinase)